MSKYRDNRPGVLYTRNFIMRSLCGIYLMAFVSFYHQSEGLFGNNGIVPTVTQFKPTTAYPTLSLLRFAGSLGLDLSSAVDLLALVGAVVAFAGFVSRYLISMPLFAVLWAIYYSLSDIMGPFQNQADTLLLEAGFICIFMAPSNARKQQPTDRLGMLMLRWLLFRFLFTSGAVKLASQCPHWWRLDGLERHLETMPLPTQLTWYAYNYIPKDLLQLTMAYVNVSELLVTFLFLAPPFPFRKLAFYWHLFLQFHIIATGNYGHMNFLVVVLLFALINDSIFTKSKSAEKKSKTGENLLMLVTLAGLGYATYYLFGVRLVNGSFTFKLNFTQEQFNETLLTAVKVAPCMCLIGILGTFLHEMTSNEAIRNAKSTFGKIFTCLKTSVFMLICLTLLSLSVVPLRRVLPEAKVDNTDLGQMYKHAGHFKVVNEYGLHMIKVRSERLEIILEHADSEEGPWIEYPMAYKPGPLNSTLSVAGPYLPRLDFELWSAAPSNIGKHMWVSSLAFRLLQSDPAVLRLLGVPVVPRKKPAFVRGMLYKLKYSKLPGTAGYWKRKALAEYLPPVSLSSELLLGHLKEMRIPRTNPKPVVKNAVVKTVLDKVRQTTQMLEGSFLTIAVLASGFALIATKRN